MEDLVKYLRDRKEEPKRERPAIEGKNVELRLYSRPSEVAGFDGPHFNYRASGKVVSGAINSEAHKQALIEKARKNAQDQKVELIVWTSDSKWGYDGPVIVHESYK
jgi:hypothetical protein